ncbi:MAG TPA: sigma-70 family RNA polymerase sigma factor [Ktedonobacterales bacterium]|nr:sigma-70 family RNA polymerase sigma factor [Ktedonobacterales bacterium]
MGHYVDSGGALSAYLQDLRHLPLLARSETATLVRHAQSGDIVARNRVVEGHLRLVVYAAKGYAAAHVPLLDLIQAGNEGLLHAVTKFDPDRGVPFTAYALWWIRLRIECTLDHDRGAIHVPHHVRVWVRKLYNAECDLLGRGEAPSDETLRALTGLTADQLAQAREGALTLLSLETLVAGDDDDAISLDDVLAIHDPSPAYDDLYAAMATLEASARKIVCWRFGLSEAEAAPLAECPDEQEDEAQSGAGEIVPLYSIAERLAISCNRIRQIEREALHHLRTLLDPAA